MNKYGKERMGKWDTEKSRPWNKKNSKNLTKAEANFHKNPE